MKSFSFSLSISIGALAILGCSSSAGDSGPKTDAQYQAEVTNAMHDSVAADVADLLAAARDLQAAAPTPAGRGWDATTDAAAITKMKDAWRRTRIAYEHIEGAVAPIFPEIDNTTDARYDDHLTQLAGKGDPDAFDGAGVTGMHAIERILFSNQIPRAVVDFEKTLPGYAPAAFPKTEAEATSFKTKLVQKLIDDVTKLQSQWTPAQVDLGAAFQGLVSLMNEQLEKVNKAATGEEESRYAQMTLFDLHQNLAGTIEIYGIFEPWIRSKTNKAPEKDGPTADAKILAGFQTLQTLYDGYAGDAVPQPPETWSSDHPTTADLATPFGKLFTAVKTAVDPATPGSIVDSMNHVADVLGFPEFKAGD
jgi:iron uptake system component EfeO